MVRATDRRRSTVSAVGSLSMTTHGLRPSAAPRSAGCKLFHHLLQNSEVAGIPRLHDDVVLVSDLLKYRIVIVLEVLQAKVFLRHDSRNQLVVFEDIDRSPFTRIGPIKAGDHGVVVQVVDIAG